jgi:hypothetical protein
VCDRCNHEALSVLDQTLCEFMPFAMMRTFRGIPSKAGKSPKFRFAQGTVEHSPGAEGSDPTLVINSNSPKGILKEVERFANGRVKMELNGTGGRRMTPRYASELSRALLKSALECAWFNYGALLLEPQFDHIREAVLGQPRDGFFTIGTEANVASLDATLTYTLVPYKGDTWRMPVEVKYCGISVGTDSQLRTLPTNFPPDAPAWTTQFTAANLPPVRVELPASEASMPEVTKPVAPTDR